MYLRNWTKDLITKVIEKKIRQKKAATLMYHSVGDNKHFFTVTANNFLWQMEYLVNNGFKLISLTELIESILNRKQFQDKTIAVTFDDGYADNYFMAFPIIKKYKIPVTIFLATDLIGKKETVRGVSMEHLTWEQIKEMSQSGLVDFGSHTKSHSKLSQLEPDQITLELKESRDLIEQNLNKDCPLFAYPFGNQNDTVTGIVKDYFKGAVSVRRGFIDLKSDVYLLPRQSIDSVVDKRRFKLKI